jgi:hypothetical protein
MALVTIALALGTSTAMAQTTPPQSGLVNVSLENILNDLSVALKIDRSNIPVTAQVPVNVAANVCGVDVNVLSAQAGGTASCTAKTGSQSLIQIVSQQMTAGTAPATSGGPAPK